MAVAGTENVPNSRASALLLIVRLSDGAIGLGASLGTSGISMSVRRRVIIDGSSLLVTCISVSSKTVNNPKFIELAKKINQTLLFRGVWFFQVKENIHGEFVLMEIAPRIAGTMGLSLGLGINFAQLSLFDMMDYDVSIIQNKYEIQIDRALYASYKTNIEFDTVYTDFDDVISLQTGVNTDVIKLLYQFKNQKKEIILLTKHAGDIYKKLDELCIAKSLFDEIIHIKNTDDKSNYITNTNAIFIDDSFAERQNVSKKKNIPVFGTDNILTLIDWRV